VSLCRQKHYSYNYLKKNNYSVLPQIKTNSISSLNVFLKKYKEVVIKPLNQKQGKGVTVGINNKKELQSAFKLAQKYTKSVIAEKYFSSEDLRVLVVNYKDIFAVKRVPANIIGDGKSNIKQLITKKNKKGFPGKRWLGIEVDDVLIAFLRKQKYTLSSVPQKDETIFLRGTANVHTGGEAHDVTNELPIEIKKEALCLAKRLKLPVIGVDYLVSSDYKKRYIIELESEPGIKLHHNPVVGKKRNPSKSIFEIAFGRL